MPGKRLPDAPSLGDRWSGVMWLLLLPLQGAAWLWMQVSGTAANAVGFVRWFDTETVVPPGVRENLAWFWRVVPQAAGLGDTGRYEQVTSAVVLLVVAFFSTLLTGGLAIGIYVVAALLVGLGVARFVPLVNRGWKGLRDRTDLLTSVRDLRRR